MKSYIFSLQFVISGEISEISETKIEITELPIRTWTQPYKENVMEPMLNGSEKVPAQITDYKEYHTDKTVKVRVCINVRSFLRFDFQVLHQRAIFQTAISYPMANSLDGRME